MGAVYRSQFRRDRETPPTHKTTKGDIALVLDIYRNDILDTDHISTLHCDDERERNYLLSRLHKLFHNGYVSRPEVPVWHPRSYKMTNKGGALLADRYGLPRKRYETRAPSRLYLDHALGLSDFMINVERSCRARKNVRLIYEHEILEQGSKVTGLLELPHDLTDPFFRSAVG